MLFEMGTGFQYTVITVQRESGFRPKYKKWKIRMKT